MVSSQGIFKQRRVNWDFEGANNPVSRRIDNSFHLILNMNNKISSGLFQYLEIQTSVDQSIEKEEIKMRRLGIVLLLMAVIMAFMSFIIAATSVRVQFFNGNTAASTNTIYANFKLVNTGTDSITLSNVKMRYYFTNDGTQSNSFACDWATAGNSNITGSFVTITPVTGADRYLEVGFASGAGTLAPGASTEVKARVWKSDWSNFTQTNDYSFNTGATNYIDSTNVTAYISGTLYWGTPADGSAVTSTPTPVRTPTSVGLTPTPTPVRTPTPIGLTPTPARTATPTPSRTPSPTPTQSPTPPPVSGDLLRVEPLPGTKINSTFWNARIKNIITTWIPYCYNQLSNTSLAEGGINNFIQAGRKLSGQSYTAHVGYWFSNAYVHNTVEAMCYACMIDPQGDSAISSAQSAMKSKLEDWIPKILSAQESDGYLHTWTTLGNNPRWTDRSAHEGYTGGYFLEAAIAHYLMTNRTDTRLYNAAKRLADCWCANKPGNGQWWDGHEEMEQAMTRFGVFVNGVEGGGRGDKYINCAKRLMDVRYSSSSGQYDQSHAYPVNQTTAVGHAVRASYLYSGMAEVANWLNNSSYGNAINTIWSNLIDRKMYITGGLGSGESSEGFGADYSLPNANAYAESCAGCGNVIFNNNMFQWTKNGKYVDIAELALYNNVLGSLTLNANLYTYTNSLDTSSARYSWHSCPCCVGNIPRTILSLMKWTYAKTSNSIYVNMYVGSTFTVTGVSGTNVQMVQTTNYPWENTVTITVNPTVSANFTIYLHSPDRSVSGCYSNTPSANGIGSITVNGSAVSTSPSNGYVAINRTWIAGDKIVLTLPLTPQRVKAVSNVSACSGRVALQYGPLIYNIESVDQDVNLILNSGSALTAQWNGSLLGGIMTIKGTFTSGATMTAIPNYARLNRGGRSLVWLRDQ
jgi:DUF1680 family protein